MGVGLMKLWIDDCRPAPEGYLEIKSVNDAKGVIRYLEENYHSKYAPYHKIDLIDIDHDAGDYAQYGGDYIKLLDWLEQTRRNYPIRIHSQNPVGIQNMRAIIKRNNWMEVF